MDVLLACLICLPLGALLGVRALSGELRRMAGFLRLREAAGSARLTTRLPLPSLAELAGAVNEQLDAMQAERVAAARRSADLERELASLSHDIRTPLMGARGRLQLAAGEPDPALRSAGIRAAARRLDDVETLLDQLFDAARASDPDLSLAVERVEVLPVLEHVLAGQYAQIVAAGVEPRVRFERPELAVNADREALARVFENVVANALRHGAGEVLRIEQAGGAVTFANRVADPASVDVGHLFDRFWRADEARGRGGSGIGLSVVRALCERMGFSVSASLVEDELTITISLG